jgi:hypothetical protein
MLTTHLYIKPRLRINGAIPLLPLYALKPWTVNILLYLYTFRYLGLKNEHHNYLWLTEWTSATRGTIFGLDYDKIPENW